MKLHHVLGLAFIAFMAMIFTFSCQYGGTGPDYKGPGIEIDVDHHKKTKAPGYKAPQKGLGGTSKRR